MWIADYDVTLHDSEGVFCNKTSWFLNYNCINIWYKLHKVIFACRTRLWVEADKKERSIEMKVKKKPGTNHK